MQTTRDDLRSAKFGYRVIAMLERWLAVITRMLGTFHVPLWVNLIMRITREVARAGTALIVICTTPWRMVFTHFYIS